MIVACRHVRDFHCFGKDDLFRIENCRRRGVTKTPFLVGLDAPWVHATSWIQTNSVKFGETRVNYDRVFRKLDHIWKFMFVKSQIATFLGSEKLVFVLIKALWWRVTEAKSLNQKIKPFLYGLYIIFYNHKFDKYLIHNLQVVKFFFMNCDLK